MTAQVCTNRKLPSLLVTSSDKNTMLHRPVGFILWYDSHLQ